MTSPAKKSPKEAILLPRKSRPLFPRPKGQGKNMSAMEFLSKAAPTSGAGTSKQGAGLGRKPHPFDFAATTSFKNFNAHHSACIETKKASIGGLGFFDETENTSEVEPGQEEKPKKKKLSKAEKALNPLCDISIQDVFGDIIEDYVQTGNGFLEVVRDAPRQGATIIGLHHVPAPSVYVHIEDRKYRRHFEVVNSDNDASALFGGAHQFAAFGDLEGFLRRNPRAVKDETSEIIHYRKPTSLSRWYGMPNWLAAVAAIELVQCLYQYKYDFYLNRGVPEFLLFLLGGDAGEKNMEALENLLQAHIGHGQSHKSGIFNIKQADLEVQLEKLGLDSGQGDDGFSEQSEVLALNVVTAHQVPPLLAGIQIPGKLGATNEMVNAMMAFQTLTVGPDQKTISTINDNTLGNELYNEGIDLEPGDFQFKTILDEIDVQKADTAGRMKEEAAGSKRDLSEGLKD